MFIKALKAKIHRANITDSQLEYPGSIGIDSDLLEASGIANYEAVLVANVNNGERIETYVVPEPAGSGKITILGAAARKFEPKDVVIIISFGLYSPEEMRTHKPRVVLADHNNGIKETR
ncbi:Aspartate 1-decarboxylase precursor [Sedimentisphaera cyanobacteriorum]|uniref:Aspartate 1-decarboxylase n=1 Tax=Sedimentisphaera cyanobacteriorum TaxID=1940790 RepID=A0A1Q2HNK1_9BACT|nr:aspartate 1-decarboxylase [Sedimentisphaera cyanobacteriorum]AQQ09027.1 Aspartate 1-decarboxylase precursor [Sedimentisphaera cyanobacteriorum]